jgi:hypothetical protein
VASKWLWVWSNRYVAYSSRLVPPTRAYILGLGG